MLLLAAVVTASCVTPLDEVETGGAGSAGGGSSEGSSVPVPTDGVGRAPSADPDAAPTVAPDPSGLPSLGDADPDTITGELDNGLRYLVRANDNPGAKAELRLTIDAGSVLEDDDQLGGAHFLEHMLFNGTERFPGNELTDVLRGFGAAFGADVNASTGYDETIYELSVPAGASGDDAVRLGLEVLEQWLSAATIAEGDVVAERGVVLDEYRIREETARGRLARAATDFLLGGTAYDGRAPIGTVDSISTMTPDPLRRFYDDWYRPDNAAVIVVGDIDEGRVEEWIVELFGDETARADPPDRPDVTVTPASSTAARIVSDPDLVEGYAFVTLPIARDESAGPEATLQREVLRSLAFDVIATRLDDDATRGEAPYDTASVASSGFVRSLVAPEVFVTVDGDGIEASVTAVVDEYERVRRFGFDPAELERAIQSRRSTARQSFDSRGSRQDASFAEEYVRHVLDDEPYVTAEREFEFISEVLDRATPETVAHVFVELLDAASPQVFAAVRADEASEAPTEPELVAIVEGAADRDLDPRAAPAAIGDTLVASPPAPVDEVESEPMVTDSFTPLLEPTVVTFPNGVRFAYNTTTIVESTVFFAGRSPGGLSALAPDSLAAGDAAGAVLLESGFGDFDRVQLDAFLDDKELFLIPSIDTFEEAMSGSSSTTDLETLFQLVHLVMTDPGVTDVAVARFIDDRLPLATDPTLDAGYAEFVALRDARYDDPRFLAPSADAVAALDADAIAAVVADRFGDAGDWTFSISGDFEPDVALDLARTYLATLPATDRVESVDYVEPPPPPGVVTAEAAAGEGDTARVSVLFSSVAGPDRRDDVLARVAEEVIGNRLLTVIREELGESYAPRTFIDVGIGATPAVDTYLSVSASPADVDAVADAVVEQVRDLATAGPTTAEFDAALAVVGEESNFVRDAQINDEVLDVLLDPTGASSFRDFVFEVELVGSITSDEVRDAIARWAPVDRYIDLRITPR